MKVRIPKMPATANWIVVVIALCACEASAFKLKPEATENERQIRKLETNWVSQLLDSVASEVISHFTDPVHEEITHRIYGCDRPNHECGLADSAPYAVVAGVRWNDNPPMSLDADLKASFPTCKHDFTAFKLPSFQQCWIDLFKDAERKAGKVHYRANPSGKQFAMIYRVHFGDLQFLHSMASWDGEQTRITRDRIMMWAEFTYRFAKGKYGIDDELRKIPIPGMGQVFRGVNWSASRLFTLDDKTFRTEEGLRQMAFGSLLHMVQDSFSKAHVQREGDNSEKCTDSQALKPGRVDLFRAYNNQKSHDHGLKDSREALEVNLRSKTPDVVSVGKTLLAFLRTNEPDNWDEVRKYLSCVYDVVDEEAPAEAGADYSK